MTGHSCAGKCQQYQVTILKGSGLSDKICRCADCDRKMVWDGLKCPCCDQRVRRHPRNSKYRKDGKRY